MIHEVDEGLRALIRRDVLNGSDVELAFDAPTTERAARRNTPTIDCYLYDIREALDRRESGWVLDKGDDGFARGRLRPVRRYRLAYLLTAWTQRPEDEHRLLSGLLACFLRSEVLSRDLLGPSLAEHELSVTTTIAMPPKDDRSVSDIWSALGGQLKPSLDLVVSAPVLVTQEVGVGPPVLEQPVLAVRTPDGESAETQTRSRGNGRRAAPVPDEIDLTAEERRAGDEERPGRTIRIGTMDS